MPTLVWNDEPLGQQEPQTILDYVKSVLSAPNEATATAAEDAGFPGLAKAVRGTATVAKGVGSALTSPPVIGAGLGAVLGGVPGAVIGGAGGQGVSVIKNWLTGEPVPSPQRYFADMMLGAVANTAGPGGARGVRAVPATLDRVLPGRFAAEQARQEGVTNLVNAVGQAGEAARNEPQAALTNWLNAIGQAGETGQNLGTKQSLLDLARPRGSTAEYAAFNRAAETAAPLHDLPGTSQTVQALLGTLDDKNPVRAIASQIDTQLGAPSGISITQVVQIMRDLARIRRPEAERLYGSLRQDLSNDPTGQLAVAAAQAFKEDVGRSLLGRVVGNAAPGEAPLNVPGVARAFQKNQEGLATRLPASELSAARDLISSAQTQAPFIPRETPMLPSFVPGTTPPRQLEGPLANEWRIRFNLLGLLGGMGAMGAGHPYAGTLAGLVPPAVEMLPPYFRAYSAIGPNAPWQNAVGAMAGQQFLGPGPYRR